MNEQIEVIGTLNLPEKETNQSTDSVNPTTQFVESHVYTGRLIQTNDTLNIQLVVLGIVLCCIAVVSYLLNKISYR